MTSSVETTSDSRFYHITPAGGVAVLPTLEAALAAEGGFVWLDFCRPTKEELSGLIAPFGLHPLSIEDCTDENQVPKIDDFPGNTFIIFNVFTYADGELTISEVDLFIGERFVITVSGRNANGCRILHDIGRVIERDTANARQGPAFLLHAILDQIVDGKFSAIEALEDELNRSEEAILDDLATFNPAGLLHLRRNLLAVRKSLFQEREILVKICRRDCPFTPEAVIYHFRDVYDHLAKFFELTETCRDLVTSLMEMYLSMLNNQMSRSSNDMNSTVRRLTFITTIFMPLTLLAGVGGMSEWTMMTGQHNWRTAYPLFLLGMIVVGVVSYYLLKRLERKGRRGVRSSKF
ncbi:MAG: magnesium transporter CorA family protein [Armatimonadota bacterium]